MNSEIVAQSMAVPGALTVFDGPGGSGPGLFDVGQRAIRLELSYAQTWEFPIIRIPYFWVLILRIRLFRGLY